MLQYKFDVQLLIEGENLSEDEIYDSLASGIPGDSLLSIGEPELIKVHYHTNEPWRVLEYAASKGDIHDIVVEYMERQQEGLRG